MGKEMKEGMPWGLVKMWKGAFEEDPANQLILGVMPAEMQEVFWAEEGTWTGGEMMDGEHGKPEVTKGKIKEWVEESARMKEIFANAVKKGGSSGGVQGEQEGFVMWGYAKQWLLQFQTDLEDVFIVLWLKQLIGKCMWHERDKWANDAVMDGNDFKTAMVVFQPAMVIAHCLKWSF
jgi:hypothetical protein